jgi:NAD(P)-dependent dehydrogenase (short-subunit alcohol dehydrogenase family)
MFVGLSTVAASPADEFRLGNTILACSVSAGLTVIRGVPGTNLDQCASSVFRFGAYAGACRCESQHLRSERRPDPTGETASGLAGDHSWRTRHSLFRLEVRMAAPGPARRRGHHQRCVHGGHDRRRDPPMVGHAAAKGGVIAMTRQLALEGARHGIRAVAICPAPFQTPVSEREKGPRRPGTR